MGRHAMLAKACIAVLDGDPTSVEPSLRLAVLSWKVYAVGRAYSSAPICIDGWWSPFYDSYRGRVSSSSSLCNKRHWAFHKGGRDISPGQSGLENPDGEEQGASSWPEHLGR
ncbi:hypothetical protein Bbelb_109420 [Branchiostoma belcheri]|nr:hypothetical protein Bbelb_109420 [Branchiostoma belcheri]